MKTKQKYKETHFSEEDDILTEQQQEEGFIHVHLDCQRGNKKRTWEIVLVNGLSIDHVRYRTTLKRAETYAKKLAKERGIKRIVVFAGARLINLE